VDAGKGLVQFSSVQFSSVQFSRDGGGGANSDAQLYAHDHEE